KHTHDKIAAWIKSILMRFEINLDAPSHPLTAFITIDIGADVKKAIETLGMLYVPCIAHQLDLVVRSAIGKIGWLSEGLQRLKMLTKLLNKSPILASILEERVKTHAASVIAAIRSWKPNRDSAKAIPTKLIKPDPTRWRANVKSLRRVLVLWTPLLALLSDK